MIGFDAEKEGELAIAKTKKAEAEAELEEIRQKKILAARNRGSSDEQLLQDMLQESTKYVDGKQVEADIDDLTTFQQFESKLTNQRLLKSVFGKDYLNNPEYLALKEGKTREKKFFEFGDPIKNVMEASDLNQLITMIQQKRDAQIQELQDADLSKIDAFQLTGSVIGANDVRKLRGELDELKDEIIRLTAETGGGDTNIFNNSETNNNEQTVESKASSLNGKSGGSIQLLKLEQKVKND